ncbi:PREDICTED: dopamine beta-hydroxylase-like [Branchiostoma belcheri]|uniref:Dopamine beta-hydroxylase n=1 Tax=Branchiostoma belcheri TaxID=7741 RepID=A0A6P4ZUI7_BRABE|nr:PREDICTED: dopamine beta-hydroxylase-like [Branchiostoma belcheri]
MSADGTMRNADFVVFWTEGNSVNAVDSWTDDRGRFHTDRSQDYRLIDSTANGQKVSVTFSRRFDTCDDHDYLIDSGTTNLLYILPEEDITAVSDLNLGDMRMRVGTKRLQLLKSDVVTPPLPPDVTSFDIRVNQAKIPAKETTYWCRTQQLPTLPKKVHILQYEPIITPGNEEAVHHMTVFLCGNDVSGTAVYDGPCVGEEERKELKTCKHVIAAWAMGAQAFAYPEEAGIPLGGPGSSTIAMIEIHYNNPQRRNDIVDSSGVRFHYTPTLRRHDAGIMELGLRYLPSMAIPPRQDGYVITGYCPAQCTTKGLPAGGIQVFASQLHTHLAGTAVWTKHVRGGVELPELNRDNHYSTMFEEIRLLRRKVTVLPGDVLMTSCKYNTTNRRSVTLGGYGIHDEMCLNYIHYYPASQLQACKSVAAASALDRFFDVVYSLFGASNRQQNVADDFFHLPWNPLTTAYLTSLYRHGPIDVMCQKTTGAIFEGEWTNLEQPHIRKPQNPQRKCQA